MAVVIGIVVVILFLGARFFMAFTKSSSTVNNEVVNTDISTNTNNNMNQNIQNNQATSTGLIIKDTVVGTGAEAKTGDLVTVNYTGKFADGTVFDSSIPRGQPFPFTLGAGDVIKGWDLGVAGMKVGGKRTLIIPSDLAYGPNDYHSIPGGSTLYFDVELLGVEKQ